MNCPGSPGAKFEEAIGLPEEGVKQVVATPVTPERLERVAERQSMFRVMTDLMDG
jgi:hypothetical protein